MISHDFKVKTKWKDGRNSVGRVQSDYFESKISIPAELNGPGEASNPDELLIAAASSCFIISLAAALERARFTEIRIDIESVGTATLNDNGKFKMESITHYPKIKVVENEKLKKRIGKLIEIADSNCMVSNTLRGNVEINVTPELV